MLNIFTPFTELLSRGYLLYFWKFVLVLRLNNSIILPHKFLQAHLVYNMARSDEESECWGYPQSCPQTAPNTLIQTSGQSVNQTIK